MLVYCGPEEGGCNKRFAVDVTLKPEIEYYGFVKIKESNVS
jgi:hypothetical protein